MKNFAQKYFTKENWKLQFKTFIHHRSQKISYVVLRTLRHITSHHVIWRHIWRHMANFRKSFRSNSTSYLSYHFPTADL